MKSEKKLIAAATSVLLSCAAFAELPEGDAAWLYTAVRNAAAGSTVTVPKGEYRLKNSLEPIANGVSIVGATGNRDDVVIDGQGVRRCIVAKAGGTISGLTVRNGYTASTTAGGGGIHATGAVITNCVIDSCFSAVGLSGGGVYAKSSSTVVDCFFTNNVVNLNKSNGKGGGALCVEDAATQVSDCTFVHNAATNQPNFLSGGGAVYFAFSAQGESAIRRCRFIGNSAHYGGAISGVPALVEDCAFTNNAACEGPVHFISVPDQNTRTVTLHKGSTVDGNVFTNGLFCSRQADGLRMEGCDIGPDNVMLTGTTSYGFIFSKDNINNLPNNFLSMSNCTVRGVTIDSTSTFLFGYGQRCSPQDVYGCEFRDLQTVKSGTAFVYLGNDGRIANSRFIRNRHTGNNNLAMVYYEGTNISVRSCLFASNTVAQGQAICVSSSFDGYGKIDQSRWATIDNCTFADNVQKGQSGVYGGQVYVTSGTVVRNCLFLRNTDAITHPVFWYSYDKTKVAGLDADEVRERMFNCCDANEKHQLTDGQNDCLVLAAAEVGLADPRSAETHDYSLAENSPCVDAGLDLDWIVPRKTLDITLARRHYRTCGGGVDIGAWEYRVVPGLLLLLR